MAERLDVLPAAAIGGSAEKYPWDEWFDGSPWLIEFDDHDCRIASSFMSTARAAAYRRGGRLKARRIGGQKGPVAIQFVEGGEA